MSSGLKTCEWCNKILHGRSDQRFCNDACRNTYNREKRQFEKIQMHPNAPEIFRVLKTNYEILKKGIPGQVPYFRGSKCDTEVFMKSGINLKFYTSSFNDSNQWFCVFDYCYSIKGDETRIICIEEQADL